MDSEDDARTGGSAKPSEHVAGAEWHEALDENKSAQVNVISLAQGQTTLNVAGLQLSLGELFFITTLCALAFWIYNWVSPILATLCGCLLLFVAVMRAVGRRPAFVGGIIGFGLAGVIGIVTCFLAKADMLAGAFAVIGIASVGYFLGAIMTELAEDDSI